MRINKFFFICILAIFGVGVNVAGASSEDAVKKITYFPLESGNEWKWQVKINGKDSDGKYYVEKVAKIYKNRVVVVADHYDENRQVRSVETEYETGDDGIYIIKRYITEYEKNIAMALDYFEKCKILPDREVPHEQWTCEGIMIIEQSSASLFDEFEIEGVESVETAMDSYDDCLKIRHLRIMTRENEPIRKESRKWFCPNVGLVKEDYGDLQVELVKINFNVEKISNSISWENEVPENQVVDNMADGNKLVELKAVGYGDLYVQKGKVSLVMSTDPSVPVIGIIGWSGDGKYISYTESVAASGNLPERLILYVVEVARGRVVSKSEKFIYEDMDIPGSSGSGVDRFQKLNEEIIKEFSYGLDKFGIKKTPGTVLVMDKSTLGPVSGSAGPGKHIAMILSPGGSGVFTLVPDAVAGWGGEKIVSWNFGSGVANEVPAELKKEPVKKPIQQASIKKDAKPVETIAKQNKVVEKEKTSPPPEPAKKVVEPVKKDVVEKPKTVQKTVENVKPAVVVTEDKKSIVVEPGTAEKDILPDKATVEKSDVVPTSDDTIPQEKKTEEIAKPVVVEAERISSATQPVAIISDGEKSVQIESKASGSVTIEVNGDKSGNDGVEKIVNIEKDKVIESATETVVPEVNLVEESSPAEEEEKVKSEVVEPAEELNKKRAAENEKATPLESTHDNGIEELKKTPVDKDSCPLGMVFVASGEFFMGCSEGDVKCDMPEWPSHKVKITKGFCMDKYEVTQSQYVKAIERNPSVNVSCGGDCPVEMVSWEEAGAYCRMTGRRLPTEAEWEYAARGGAKTAYFWGASEGKMDEYVWYWKNAGNALYKVGKKKANKYGLHDMLGGLWEWTQDCFSDAWYDRGGLKDPVNNAPGCAYRVIRGGSRVNADPAYHRVSKRNPEPVGSKTRYIGFRCVTDTPDEVVSELLIDPRAGEDSIKSDVSLPVDEPVVGASEEIPPMPGKGGPSSGMKCPANMFSVPPGDYWIGCDTDVCMKNNVPRHKVSITKGFCVDNYLVTQKRFDTSTGYLNYYGNLCGEACPAEMISWDEGLTYCEKNGKRLLTEAEWEVAAEKGLLRSASDSNSMLSGGIGIYGGAAELDEAWEWVYDCYDAKWYSKRSLEDPVNDVSSCSIRTLRGGALAADQVSYLNIRMRDGSTSGTREENIGFRCAATR